MSVLASSSSLALDALALIAEGLAASADPALVEPSNGARRVYVEVLRTNDYNAWLIGWASAGALEPHDHGASAGAVHVVRGRLLETYTDGAGAPLQTRVADAGDTFTVPAGRIHEVWNPGVDLAVSVHVYSPPLRDMAFFDLSADGDVTPR